MKIRLNRGIKNTQAVGLIMEGARRNSILPNPFKEPDEGKCQIIGAKFLGEQRHQKFPDAPLWSFQLTHEKEFLIEFPVECTEINMGYTFSMYATSTITTPTVVLVCISDGNEKKCDYIEIVQEVRRFEIPHEFAKSPSSFMVSIQGKAPELAIDGQDTLGFAYVTIEDGLFASSAIPAGNNDGYRSGERLSYQRDGNMFVENTGTLSFEAIPNWTGPQLDKDHSAYFIDCASNDFRHGISIFADGSDYGILKARFITDGLVQSISTDIIPIRGKLYTITLRWTPGLGELLVNGRVSSEITGLRFPDPNKLGDMVFVGSTGRSEKLGAFSVITNLTAYNSWLKDRDIQAFIYASKPHLYPHFIHQYQDATGEQKARYLNNDSWSFQFVNWLLRIPRQWQEQPPVWLLKDGIDEGHCRDEIKRYLNVNNEKWNGIPEYHQYEGRTDLLINDKVNPDLNFHMEFKVWGRHDYKNVPEKPLKYFLEGDNIGAVLMINQNKIKMIGKDYRNNVLSSPTGCIELIERPFETDTSPDHFISIHESENRPYVEILHIIVNKHGPYGIK